MQAVEYLLEPINNLHSEGKDLTCSVDFDDFRKLRSSDGPTLNQGEWVTDLKVANWPKVVKRCFKLLKDTTKDLRLVSWMTEALVHIKRLAAMVFIELLRCRRRCFFRQGVLRRPPFRCFAQDHFLRTEATNRQKLAQYGGVEFTIDTHHTSTDDGGIGVDGVEQPLEIDTGFNALAIIASPYAAQ